MASENAGPQQPPPEVQARTLAVEDRARMFLESLGHADHPLAGNDPLYALYQVAIDYRCMAQGYEGLLRDEDATQDN